MDLVDSGVVWAQHRQSDYVNVALVRGQTIKNQARTRLVRRRVLQVEYYVGADPALPDGYKTCCVCGISKPATSLTDPVAERTKEDSEFYRQLDQPDGNRVWCIACERAYRKGLAAGQGRSA